MYASSSDRLEIWPMVVEKAFAKLHGTWEAIGHGGLISAALQALTGGVAVSLSTDEGRTSCGRGDALWATLRRAVEDPGVLVGAGTRRDCPDEVRRGIIVGHAYSVLHAVEVAVEVEVDADAGVKVEVEGCVEMPVPVNDGGGGEMRATSKVQRRRQRRGRQRGAAGGGKGSKSFVSFSYATRGGTVNGRDPGRITLSSGRVANTPPL
jgi:hypothetical protein